MVIGAGVPKEMNFGEVRGLKSGVRWRERERSDRLRKFVKEVKYSNMFVRLMTKVKCWSERTGYGLDEERSRKRERKILGRHEDVYRMLQNVNRKLIVIWDKRGRIGESGGKCYRYFRVPGMTYSVWKLIDLDMQK